MTAHSGYSNAFTASTSTNYFFEISVSPEDDAEKSKQANGTHVAPLYGALDRFAQFFIEPLFLEETLDRELRAVDSENKKNLQDDTWRLYQLSKSLANPAHPFNGFSTGNLKTLHDEPLARGVKIRDEFMRFHREQYSANRMKLVVLGRESLDQLQDWVEELFAGVENKDLPQNRWDNIPLFTPKERQMMVYAKPVMDKRYLEIMWPYPDEEELYDSQPGHYLSHLIGHEGPGSILSYTKAKGWVDGLSAGSSSICPGSGRFSITLSLTPEGLKRYEELAEIVFQYISILKKSDPQEWIFSEIKTIAEVDFKFKQKASASRTTSGLSQTMQDPIPRDRLLSGYSWPRIFDPAMVKRGLSFLTVDDVRFTLVSSEKLPGKVKKEKWYGTEYSTMTISPDFLKRLHDAESGNQIEDLHIPGKNEFIPTRLDVERREVKEPAKAPKLIRNDDQVRLWYKKDDQFWVPKANVEVTMRNSISSASPLTAVMGLLLGYLVEDALVEYSYDAELAGLYYSINGSYTGASMSVNGYNDKMHLLLERVLTTLKTIELKEDRFEICKERLARAYRNSDLGTPYQQVSHYTRYLLTERSCTYKQLLAQLEPLTLEQLKEFHPLFLQKIHLEILVQGNVYREEALKWASLMERVLQPQGLPEEHWPRSRSFDITPGQSFVFRTDLEDPLNVNHAINYILPLGPKDDHVLRAKSLLFAQMTSEPAFDQLRTKEQLGYVVFSGSTTYQTRRVYYVLIQSERQPWYLESRVDHFLVDFAKELAEMNEEQFEDHKRSIINKRLEKSKNLNQEAMRFWDHISSEYYQFDAVDEDVKHLKPLTKEDIVQFYEQYIHPASEKRAKLSIHLIAKAQSEETVEVTPEARAATLAGMAVQLLKTTGDTADEDKLNARFMAVDCSQGLEAAILEAFQTYCEKDSTMTAEHVTEVVAEAKQALPVALPKLALAKEGAKVEEPVKTKPMKRIDNVSAWKSSMPLSEAARPMKDLSVYEDLAKL